VSDKDMGFVTTEEGLEVLCRYMLQKNA
jgi:hypothetical protein